MGKFTYIISVVVATAMFVSCGGNTSKPATATDVRDSYEVKGITFTLTKVPGGPVSMGTMADGRHITGSNVHQTVLDGYAICSLPVSQALWQAVMGGSGGSESVPIDRVSYKDVRKFLAKLSKTCGIGFNLPTEAQWELALNEGLITVIKGAREWVADNWSSEDLLPVCMNYVCEDGGSDRVVRTSTERAPLADYTKAGALCFRLVVNIGEPCDQAVVAAFIDQKPEREHVCSNERIMVNGVPFDMVAVRGGIFKMGAGEEQAEYGDDNEKPVHEVSVEDFEIGRSEVTARQWLAVMGSLPLGNREKDPDKPVINVTWYSAQTFILKLNELSGRKFRLPTEAEWEYAARGGKNSRGYRFSGANEVYAVAAYTKNTDGKVTPVMRHLPNELGIYDMSGNAWEWCQDCYYDYGTQAELSEWHIQRGGSAASPWTGCRVSNRQKIPAINTKGTFGFRLAI